MKPKTVKSKRKTFYYPPELMPFACCSACLYVVLDENERAAELFDDIIECYKLPGWVEIFDKVENGIPDSLTAMKTIVKNAGFDFYEHPTIANMGIPHMRRLMKSGFKFASGHAERITRWGLKDKSRVRDLKILADKLEQLIKIGFNNEFDVKRGKYKVSTNSEWLVNTILTLTLLEHIRLRLPDWDNVKIMTVRNRTYSLVDMVNDETTTRIHKNLAKEYKSAGFVRKYPETVNDAAKIWYQCRVVYSSTKEYCRRLKAEKGIESDSANISNQIKECDEAVGYTRARTVEDPIKEKAFENSPSRFYEMVNRAKGLLRKKKKR